MPSFFIFSLPAFFTSLASFTSLTSLPSPASLAATRRQFFQIFSQYLLVKAVILYDFLKEKRAFLGCSLKALSVHVK